MAQDQTTTQDRLAAALAAAQERASGSEVTAVSESNGEGGGNDSTPSITIETVERTSLSGKAESGKVASA